ncbi:uncharacterized protein LOC122854038 [Aphidius gifuensis]|uniref:uncharacterized protein LOC122854038 n=1 Tax=Aphidius gifuensis TaxID=684658 RepID=UPI001CDD4FFB|nr:uncharacterized protein LOC122854038 [Aphidius gifuensis]
MSEITTRNQKKVNEFGDNGGYFDSIVKPILQYGHEDEFRNWLQDMKLIKSSLTCSKPDCYEHKLIWQAARVIDKFVWKCTVCHKNYAIRDASFFHGIHCDLKTSIGLILAWCQNIPPQTIALMLGTQDLNAKKMYKKCTKMADTWVERHIDEFFLGGPGKVLVIYEYPGGNMLSDVIEIVKTDKHKGHLPIILCIIEANNIPPRMWFHIMQKTPKKKNQKNDDTINNDTFDEAMNVIKGHILPGSFIVADKNAECYDFNAIVELKNYQTFSIDFLEKFDNDAQKLRDNLATIWQSAVDIFEDVVESPKSQRQSILSSYLWRQKFNFQNMLEQIADEYRFE